MYNSTARVGLHAGYSLGATASQTTTLPGTNSQERTNGEPRVRQGDQSASGQSLIDAYRASSSGKASAENYVAPGPTQISAALANASAAELYAMLRAAVVNCDAGTLQAIRQSLSAMSGHTEAARAALNEALNAGDAKGDTLLTSLLKNRPEGEDARGAHHLTLLELLLLGADPKRSDCEGNTAAILAIRYEYRVSVISLLLERGSVDHANDSGETALSAAVVMGNERVVEMLLEHGASPALQTGLLSESALQLAWNDPDYRNDSIKEMLRKAAPQQQLASIVPAGSVEQQAFQAVRAGDRKTLERLLKAQSSLVKAKTESGHTLMMLAAIHGKLDIARLLRDNKASRNATTGAGDTALLYAIRHGHAHLASFLIDAGADVNCRNMHGYMPLAYAASKGLAGTVVKLLEHGAENKGQLNDSSLLECAFESGSLETVQVLIAYLAESAEGRTTLGYGFHRCIVYGIGSKLGNYLTYAEMLFDAGINIDMDFTAPTEGTTALMLLAKFASERTGGSIPMASMLLARGADPQRKNAEGQTALDIARAKGYQPMIDLLSGGAPSSTASSFSAYSTSSTSSSSTDS